MRKRVGGWLGLAGLAAVAMLAHGGTWPVPSTCDAGVNQGLAQLIAQSQGAGSSVHQDNVMVCGTALRPSLAQHAGHSGTGAHHLLILTVPAQSGPLTVEVVTNDTLDGVVTANQGDAVFAYGQAFVDPGSRQVGGFAIAGGLHEPHCATHAGADDGWVVVAGTRYPQGGCPYTPFVRRHRR